VSGKSYIATRRTDGQVDREADGVLHSMRNPSLYGWAHKLLTGHKSVTVTADDWF